MNNIRNLNFNKEICFLLLIIILTHNLIASSAKSKECFLRGHVFTADSSIVIPNAFIWVDEIPWGEVDGNGFFEISLEAGRNYLITISCIGFKSLSKKIIIRQGENEINYFLPIDVIHFPSIQVEASSSKFTDKIGNITFTTGDIKRKRAPILQDPIRILEGNPVVNMENDFNTRLIVRGGSSDQVRFKIDNLPLFDIYHIGGILSAINPDPIHSMELKYAGFNGEDGDRLSASIKINTLSESNKRLHGKISLSLISESYFVKINPFNRHFFYLAYRRTHYNTAGRIIKNTFPYGFYDVIGKWHWKINDTNILSINGFQSTDFATFTGSDTLGNKHQIKWGNRAFGINLTSLINQKMSLESNLYYTQFWNSANVPFKMKNTKNIIEEYGIRQQLVFSLAEKLFRIGWKYNYISYSYCWEFFLNKKNSGAIDFGPYIFYDWAFPDEEHNNTQSNLHAWLDFEQNITKKQILSISLRYFDLQSKMQTISPSIGYNYRISPLIQLSLHYDRMTQSICKFQDRGALDIMGLWFENGGRISKMDQYAIEMRAQFLNFHRFRFGAYFKNYSDLGRSINRGPTLIFGKGQSTGIELSLRKTAGLFQYSVDYTWSFALSQFSKVTIFQKYDKRHRLHIESVLNFSKRLFVSLNFYYSSGAPYYPWNIKYVKMNPAAIGNDILSMRLDFLEPVQSNVNTARFPEYHRMDISISYLTSFLKRDLSIILGIFNIYNHKNIYYYSTPIPRYPRSFLTGIPFLPSIEFQLEL
ncbi:MAG: hypothetical protein V1715_06750 [bacterium]